ncbi:MAG: class I SAM-dependent methyltransferase [Spirochaetes bacterium]|nr:class I SAM-dependent methyltransferase [Spirochaetota bacterium]
MKLYHELARSYFAIENNHRDIRRDVSFITALLKGHASPALLDLGCGTGEHLALLSREGIQCTGVDISGDMIAAARERCPHAIEFIQSDMMDIDFDNAFDIIISLFGSFNYLVNDSDIEETLGKVRRSMKARGIGVFEIWNARPIRKIRGKQVGPVSTTSHDGAVIRRERGFRLRDDPLKSVVDVNYRYTIQDGGRTKTLRDRHVMRPLTAGEIMAFLEKTGFTAQNIYANFLAEPYDENSSRMVVVFAR